MAAKKSPAKTPPTGGQNKATSASNYRTTSSQAVRAAQPAVQAIARKTEKKVLASGPTGVSFKEGSKVDKLWKQGEKEVIAAYNAYRKSAFSGKPVPKKK